jgi:flagellar basal body-associated protein FliL
MSDKDDAPEATEAPKPKLAPQALLVLGNTLLVLAAAGAVAYFKLMYKKPVIEEHAELEKKQEELKKTPEPSERPLVSFDQLSVNIAMTSGKQHYATIAFAVECRDEAAAAVVNAKKAAFTDKVIAALAKRQMTELSTIQGRLLLKSELIRAYNELTATATAPGAVTDMYFSTFILQ